jgi:hypothetical protein
MAVALKAAGAAILPYAVDIKVSRKPEKNMDEAVGASNTAVNHHNLSVCKLN